jgi:hypothetical protein
MPAQHRVLVPEHEQLGIFRPVNAGHQDGPAEHPARQQVDDLEQHPASQPPLRPSAGNSAGDTPNRVFERHSPLDPEASGVHTAGENGDATPGSVFTRRRQPVRFIFRLGKQILPLCKLPITPKPLLGHDRSAGF